MSKRWSILQTRLYNLMEPSINMQLLCAVYEMNSNDGWHGNKLPRYYITIGKDIVFDYPKQFEKTVYVEDGCIRYMYPYITAMNDISDVIAEYIQRPESEILEPFEKDEWGITDILRVCDRRTGKRRLQRIKDSTDNEILLKIIDKRLTNGCK